MAEMGMNPCLPEMVPNGMTAIVSGKNAKKAATKQDDTFCFLLNRAVDQAPSASDTTDNSMLPLHGFPVMIMPMVLLNPLIDGQVQNQEAIVQAFQTPNNAPIANQLDMLIPLINNKLLPDMSQASTNKQIEMDTLLSEPISNAKMMNMANNELQPIKMQPELVAQQVITNQATRDIQHSNSQQVLVAAANNTMLLSSVMNPAFFAQALQSSKISTDQKQSDANTLLAVEDESIELVATVSQTSFMGAQDYKGSLVANVKGFTEQSPQQLTDGQEKAGNQIEIAAVELVKVTEQPVQLFGHAETLTSKLQVESVSGTNNATPTPMPDTHDIMAQIVEQARMINRTQNSEMVVKLKPEHLGELTLKVTVEKGTVSASFHSNNPEVRAVLEASLSQLKQELLSQGLKVEYVGVYAGLNQFSSNQQQQSAQQAMKTKNRKADEQSFEEIAEAVSAISTQNADGVDYRI